MIQIIKHTSRLVKTGILSLVAATAFAPLQGAEVRVDSVRQQEMIYGMDFERLWSWHLHPAEAAKLARYAVQECKVGYVRVAIDGASEFEEGKFDWDAYKTQLNCMETLKQANPNIEFFASPRPIHEAIGGKYGGKSEQARNAPFSCFPLWIGIFDNPYNPRRKMVEFDWKKAADYMARQVKFLQSKGYNIAYMDVKNENDRFYRPKELALMVDRIRSQMGDKMPKVIAPSSYDWGGAIQWLKDAEAIHRTDFFDIVSSHNTKNRGDIEELGRMAKRLGKSLWNTELHGFQGPDNKAVENTDILFRHIRAGFGGINDWLSLGNATKEHKMFRNVGGRVEIMRVYYIFKQLVNTSGGGNYLNTNIPSELTSTTAFIQDNTLTVWLLNASDKDVADVKVNFPGMKSSDNAASTIWWGPSNGREGSTGIARMTSPSSLALDVKANSLYCVTVKLSELPAATSRQIGSGSQRLTPAGNSLTPDASQPAVRSPWL